MTAPAFSVILGYRNRENWRLEACLRSLTIACQDIEVEILVLDYGSSDDYALQASRLCSELGSLVRYAFAPTTGQPWNRSQALNLGADLATGSVLVFGDIDLVYSPNFFEEIARVARPGLKLNYRCRYLPEGTGAGDYRYQAIAAQHGQAPLSLDHGLGLTIIHHADFTTIGGYDERFMLWGIEDIALHDRAKDNGLAVGWIEPTQTCAFHIWHPRSVDELPKHWYVKMWALYEQTRAAPTARYADWQSLTHRPLLKGNLPPQSLVLLNDDVVSHTHQFYQLLTDALPGTHLALAADRHGLRPNPVVRRFNRTLSRLGVQYRMTAAQIIEGLWEPDERYLSTMLYFLLYNRGRLADFSILESDRQLVLTVVKR